MKARVITVDGNTYTLTGDLAKFVHDLFTRTEGVFTPIRWVGNGEKFINFDHVVSVHFIETEESK